MDSSHTVSQRSFACRDAGDGWNALFSIYDLEHTDVKIDTISVAIYAKGIGLYVFGYSRDRYSDLSPNDF